MTPSSLEMYQYIADELQCEVLAFGSRSKDKERPDSDLDVGIPLLNYRHPDPNHLRAINKTEEKFGIKVDARNSLAAYRNSITVQPSAQR